MISYLQCNAALCLLTSLMLRGLRPQVKGLVSQLRCSQAAQVR